MTSFFDSSVVIAITNHSSSGQNITKIPPFSILIEISKCAIFLSVINRTCTTFCRLTRPAPPPSPHNSSHAPNPEETWPCCWRHNLESSGDIAWPNSTANCKTWSNYQMFASLDWRVHFWGKPSTKKLFEKAVLTLLSTYQSVVDGIDELIFRQLHQSLGFFGVSRPHHRRQTLSQLWSRKC